MMPSLSCTSRAEPGGAGLLTETIQHKIFKKMPWSGTENKERENFQDIVLFFLTPYQAFLKIELFPRRIACAFCFFPGEKSSGILPTSPSKFWQAHLGTACADRWRLSIPYQKWLSLDVESGSPLPSLRVPKTSDSKHKAGAQKATVWWQTVRWEAELAQSISKVTGNLGGPF